MSCITFRFLGERFLGGGIQDLIRLTHGVCHSFSDFHDTASLDKSRPITL